MIVWLARIVTGLAAGVAIVAVDNFAFEGEVSPIIIVAMLFTAAATPVIIWSWRGLASAAAAWACVPSAHLVKHLIGLPDTLHPNTYTSILMLAAFTLAITAIGAGFGALVRRLVTQDTDSGATHA